MEHLGIAHHSHVPRRLSDLGAHAGHLVGMTVMWPALGYITVERNAGWWVAFASATEAIVGRSQWAPDERWTSRWVASKLYRILPVLWALILAMLLFAGLSLAARIHDALAWSPRGLFLIGGLVLTLGLMRGLIASIVSHELMHRGSRLEWLLAEVLMGLSTYPHFCIEHVYGHHTRVATPDDPATARYGESIYRFFCRSIPGAVAGAWRIETRRLQRKGRPGWSSDNRMLRYAVALGALYTVIGIAWGVAGIVVFAAQSVVSILALETANYIEHYGLVRDRLADGRWERVQPWHSWDTSSRVTNALLLGLGRHSEHHLNARRPYHALRVRDDAPQLPVGYFAMAQLAFVPPLWFRTMNPRVPVHARPTLASADTG